VLAFFQWMEQTGLSQFFLNSAWATPVVQCIHLVAVVVFIGAVLIVDIRLMGRGLTGTPLPQLARATQPFLVWGFVILVLSGIPQMASTAMKQYFSPFFWWKMEAMLFAVILTVTVRRRLATATDAQLDSFWPKVVGLTSMSLWTAVIIGARLIGLLG